MHIVKKFKTSERNEDKILFESNIVARVGCKYLGRVASKVFI